MSATGINLGRAFLTVEASTRGLAPAIAKAWEGAEKSASRAGRAAGASYAGETSKPLASVRGQVADAFKDAGKTGSSAGRAAGDGFAKNTEKSSRGIRGRLRDLFKGVDREGEAAGRRTGSGFNKGFGSVLSTVTKAAGIFGIGLSIGKVLSDGIGGGLNRYLTRQNALLKLEALGFAEDVREEIASVATAHVQGTAFGSGQAIQIAADLSLAGQSGDLLDDSIGKIVNLSALTGSDMPEIGTIFSRIAMGEGTAITMELNQLQDRGAPIFDWLSKTLGVTVGEVRKLSSEGKISFEDFSRAIEENLDPEAAKIMATGFEGSLANMKSALSQVGEQFWNEFGPGISSTMQWIMDALKAAIPIAKEFFEGVGDWLERAKPHLENFRDLLVGAFDRAKPVIADTWETIKGVFGFLAEHKETVLGIVVALGAFVAGFKLATGVIRAFTAVQAALNVVMNLNPIGLVVGALAALVAGFIYAYKRSETFRNIVHGALDAVKNAAVAVADWFRGPFLDFFRAVWDGLKDGVGAVGDFFAGVWDGIMTGVQAVADFFQATWDTIVAGLQAVGDFFAEVWDGIKTAVAVAVGVVWTIIQLYVGFWTSIFKAFADFFVGIWESIWSFLEPIVSTIVTFVSDAWESARDLLVGVLTRVRDFFVEAWTTVRDFVVPLVTAMRDRLAEVWQAISDRVSSVFTSIRDFLVSVWTRARDSVVSIATRIRDRLRSIWDDVKARIERIFGAVRDFFVGTWEGIRDTAVGIVDNIRTTISDKFKELRTGVEDTVSRLRDGLSTIWDGIKAVFRDPINAVINFVNDPFISNINKLLDKFGVGDKKIPKLSTIRMASGGVLPGFTPGRDVHDFFSPDGTHLRLSGGEAIMRPEWVKAVGGERAVHYMNKQARRGVATDYDGSHRRRPWRFASGGVVWPAGTRRMSNNYAGHTGVDIAGPIGTPIYAPMAGRITHAGWGRGFGYSIRMALVNGLQAVFGHLLPGTIRYPVGATVPRGARIASMDDTGNSTGSHLHFEVTSAGPLGGAANRSGTLAFLRGASVSSAVSDDEGGGFLDAVTDMIERFIKRPLRALKDRLVGGSGIIGELASGALSSIVDWGIDGAKGLLGFDRGGWLMPGVTPTFNGTGKPEAVFTSEQWADISRVASFGVAAAAGGSGSGDQITVNGIKYDSAEEFAREVEKAKRRAERRRRYTSPASAV